MTPPNVRPLSARLLVGVVVVALAGCGETYINDRATVTTADSVPPTTLAPVPAGATTDELFEMLDGQLAILGSAVAERRDPQAIGDRIDQIWAVLEPELDDAPAVQANVQVIVDMAHTAIDRKRPADADKARRLLSEQIKAR